MTFWKWVGVGRCCDTLKGTCKLWGDRLQGLLSCGEVTARREMGEENKTWGILVSPV